MVDTIFADVAQPDQARIVAINAHMFLKNGGHFVISIKVSLHLLQRSVWKVLLGHNDGDGPQKFWRIPYKKYLELNIFYPKI